MQDRIEPWTLTASHALALMRAGRLGVEEWARSCLSRAEARDPALRVWSLLDPALVLANARALDRVTSPGPLHGIPIAIKDMIDTRDMPTRYNSPLYATHQPAADAACVEILRAAGALIFGKTDTTEFAAAGRNALTGNPWNATHTPGGSSSGSAAAVADYQVPLALGTQTGGSTIRPASFCGVFAMKPTWGIVSREGAKIYALSLDTIGWFARSIADLALVADAFGIEDDAPPPPLDVRGARIAVCRSPAWPAAEPDTRQTMEQVTASLTAAGATLVPLDLSGPFQELIEAHRVILLSEGRASFLSLYRAQHALLHEDFRAQAENRAGLTRAMLAHAYNVAADCRQRFDRLAADFDAVLTPSAPGEAPSGRIPGNPIFNMIWTLLHVPCINIPAASGSRGLPIGVTLTSPRFTDRRLLSLAAALAPVLTPEPLAIPA